MIIKKHQTVIIYDNICIFGLLTKTYLNHEKITKLGVASTLLLFLLIIGTTTTSCKKVQGCMDSVAKNYDALAEKDDGSCIYEGKVVFWYTEPVSEYLINDRFVTSLAYYVGGELVGSSAASVSYTSNPECGYYGAITVTRDLGKLKSKQYSYKIEDGIDGEVIWSGSINFEANSCLKIQLIKNY
jgi:hypothetical protein